MREVLRQAREWCALGQPVALARVIAAEGSAPRPVGSALAAAGDGRFAGSVSGGCVEGEVMMTAQDVLAGGAAQTLHFRGDADPLTEVALGCGGTATIFVERITQSGALLPAFDRLLDRLEADAPATLVTKLEPQPEHWLLDNDGHVLVGVGGPATAGAIYAQSFASRPRLVVVGADAVGQAVTSLAAQLGWRVTVIDPRGGWLTPARFPQAQRMVAFPDEALAQMVMDERTALVVLSHDPKIDEPALVVALRSPAGYIGALGSRTAQAARRERLRALGFAEADLARLHAPVGLDLGGHSPEEVALSIVAEIVAARNGRAGGALRQGAGPIHDIRG
jgi:xanthine dehydrogenase accessory factor